MKKIWFLSLLCLVLCGCVSSSMGKYQHATLSEINAKRHANNASPGSTFNIWKYAGSDDQYDYVYEFLPGIFLAPPSDFHYYKLDKGQVDLPGRYPFAPNIKTNDDVFDW